MHKLRYVSPNARMEAISIGEEIYVIDPVLCTECVGHYDTPTCQKFARLQTASKPDPEHQESEEQL